MIQPFLQCDLDNGRYFVETLHAFYDITAAFWYFHEEDEHWMLIIAMPLHNDIGGLETLGKVHEVLGTLDPASKVSVQAINIVPPDDPILAKAVEVRKELHYVTKGQTA